MVLRRRLKRCGKRTSFDPITSTFVGLGNISLGEDVFVGPRCFISADRVAVSIGDDTIIGPEFCAIAGDHEFESPGTLYRESSRGENAPIEIGANVWIGARVTVLKGVRVGDGAVIAAGSLVTNDVPSMTVAAGAPAQVVRKRFTGQDAEVHRERLQSLGGRVRVPGGS
jgi:acetyltransferase-like isoleucine patch superfamily enzyme